MNKYYIKDMSRIYKIIRYTDGVPAQFAPAQEDIFQSELVFLMSAWIILLSALAMVAERSNWNGVFLGR